jgi:hypothetical protein
MMTTTDTSPPEWAALRCLAEAATPGPWLTDQHHAFVWGPASEMIADSRVDLAPKLPGQVPIIRARGVGGGLPIADNMDFVAAANPAAVLALLARAEKAEAERDRLRAAILDTAQHDAGLVPMRLRLLAKGETGHE